MVRRLLLPVLLAGLGVAGAASASLVTGGSLLAAVTASTAAGPCGATTAVASTPASPSTTSFTTTRLITTVATTVAVTASSSASPPCTTSGSTSTRPAATTTPATTSVTTSVTTAVTTTTGPPALLTSPAASTLVITGHGWGHGMGMSQWGADGYAQHGWSYTRILDHYYRGATVAREPLRTVRVLLLAGRRRVTIDSGSPWHVIDEHGKRLDLPAGRLTVPASLLVSGRKLASPLTFSPGLTPLTVGNKPYRGRMLVVSDGKKLQVVNALGLDLYVRGVVGSEVPATWPAAALEAQAVAARSFALAEIQAEVTASPFDVYGDTRSQVYGGIDAESPAVTQAVVDTSREVVLYAGKVATTVFSSSSGGRTVSAAEATGTAVPYLVSVADPYDTLSPYHDWGPVLVDARAAATALGVTGRLLDLRMTPGPSGHAATVTAVGSTSQRTLNGSEVRAALGLRSSWFQVGWLTLAAPAEPMTAGGSALLTGVVRGLTGVSLELKTPAAGWQTLTAVTPDGAGSFAVAVRPQATARYRLATGNIRGGIVKLPVVPLVRAVLDAAAVEGTVHPAIAGSALALQRRWGKVWVTIATGITDASGRFLIPAPLLAGSYRVRCEPGHGLSPGASPILVAP